MCNTKLYGYLQCTCKCISEILITIYEFSLVLCMQCKNFFNEFGHAIFESGPIIINADPEIFCYIVQRCANRSATAELKNTGV